MLVQQQNETVEQFEQRKINVRNGFVTLVTIAAPDGEGVTGNTRDIFDSTALPERIQSILINTANGPKTLNIVPQNWVSLFLDFRRPPLLNFGVMPSAPTENASSYQISANSEPWATALSTRLRQFFRDRAKSRNWIHKPGSYDALVMLLGLPLTLWASYHLGPILITSSMPGAVVTAIYVYLFFALLNVFRALFSYTRWVFPIVELEGPLANPTKSHRLFWYTLIIGLVIGVATDFIVSVIKVFATH